MDDQVAPSFTGSDRVSDRVMRDCCRFAQRTGGFPRAVSVRPFILRLRDRDGGLDRFRESSRVILRITRLLITLV
jgi:hypothetical protein